MSKEPNHADQERFAAKARRDHWWMLAIASGVVVLSFLLQVRSDQRVEFRFLPDYPLPHVCGSRGLFGVDCPGCGLTRSFIHLAQGDWTASLAVHRLGWLLAFALLVQFPYRLLALRFGKRWPRDRLLLKLFGYSLIVALAADWVCALVF